MASQIVVSVHLHGDLKPRIHFYPDGIESQPTPYASVSFAGVTLFVNEPGQAAELAEVFAQAKMIMPLLAAPEAEKEQLAVALDQAEGE